MHIIKVMLILLPVIFLVSIVYAQDCWVRPPFEANCAGGENLIFRISGFSNALAELPSQHNYPYKVCCSGYEYNCKARYEPAITLSDRTGALVGYKYVYPIDICLASKEKKPIECVYVDSNAEIGTPSFADVAKEYWAYEPIETLYRRRITIGCGYNENGQLIYCPEDPTTKAMMAAFIYRALEFGGECHNTNQTFIDVPANGTNQCSYWNGTVYIPCDGTECGYVFHEEIEKNYQMGIIKPELFCSAPGESPPRFCPDKNITRAQAAIMITRALENLGEVDPTSMPLGQSFIDVNNSYWAFREIEIMYEKNIFVGCIANSTGLYFCPEDNLTRAQMAVVLNRAFHLSYFCPKKFQCVVSINSSNASYVGDCNAYRIKVCCGPVSGLSINPVERRLSVNEGNMDLFDVTFDNPTYNDTFAIEMTGNLQGLPLSWINFVCLSSRCAVDPANNDRATLTGINQSSEKLKVHLDVAGKAGAYPIKFIVTSGGVKVTEQTAYLHIFSESFPEIFGAAIIVLILSAIAIYWYEINRRSKNTPKEKL